MKGLLSNSVQEKLGALDQQIRRRAAQAIAGYSLGALGVATLYLMSPFGLNRIGSIILLIALFHMIWKVYEASRDALRRHRDPDVNPLLNFGKVDAQIRLVQSLIHNLPFLVGANLFFMGLPGPGSAEAKAWLDCGFLLGTVLLFSGSYAANQEIVRSELLPLRRELERCALVGAAESR